MSFVRLLSPSRAVRAQSPSSVASSSSPAPKAAKPTLSLHVPGYGAIIATQSEPNPLDPSTTPTYDLDLRGELEIRMPPGTGHMRCKSIRVGIRTRLEVAIKGRKKEEHVIFDRRVEIIGGTSEGVWLEEGSQRYVHIHGALHGSD
jgi:hypothetical protein